MIDFKKKLTQNNVERKTDPIELYKTLDRKSVAGPLRPAQANVLNEWYQRRRDSRNLIIKLHTGEGKTLIGLLILQSRINSKESPCLYICPNKYLVAQVCEEAEKFGIPFCYIDEDGQLPNEFLSGEKLLITHAHKLFNGKSVFGINNASVAVGTIILDDSHACIEVIKNAFTITITKNQNEALYQSLLTLFADDLCEQGEGSFIDIKAGEYETFMPVPYWSWFDKKSEVLQLLSEHSSKDQIKFVWPLMRDKIKDYCCYISGSKIEIAPYNPCLSVFGSFSSAKYQILMSATTQDDSFFVKGLDFAVDAVKNPLMNTDQKWSGEKMIIIPSLINDNCDRDLVITEFAKEKHEKFGMVALIPGTRRVQQYRKLGATITESDNIFEQIDRLKKGNFNQLLVINNRYDGIDLPDECCRVLIVDSMPFFDSLSDRYEEKCRPNSEIVNKRIAQKIEQGIGRGVRGEKDYCAIIVVGPDLVKFMRSIITNKYFSAQTKKQIEIGLEIAKMAQEEKQNEEDPAIRPIFSLINQMLRRDEGWKSYYVAEMNVIKADSHKPVIYDQLQTERLVEELFCKEEYEPACTKMQKHIDELNLEPLDRGWYLQHLARYQYLLSKDKSIQLQKAAFTANPQLLKPKIGIEYTKVSYINENRLNRIRKIMSQYQNSNELTLAIDALLDNLSFGIESDKFEKSLKEIGELLGFISQRPDREIRKGPDNLWCGVNNQYLLFECKNEVEETRKEINKQEAGQMNSHCAWFEEQYGKEAKVSYFMIIPTKVLSYYGNFTHNVRIIRRNKLRELKKNIKNFSKELLPYLAEQISDEKMQHLINLHKLNAQNFATDYSEEYYPDPTPRVK